MALFSLTWESYKNNFFNGLSSLQQNGEFVDMTLAADGHFVKVHRMIVSLASPYIKDLLSSAPCNHPVIFLNKVSYTTLCAILEYIYTGEVLICKDRLPELMEAAKALGIKGFEELKLDLPSQDHHSQITAQGNEGQPLKLDFPSQGQRQPSRKTNYSTKPSVDCSTDLQEVTEIEYLETSDMPQLGDTADHMQDDDDIIRDHSIVDNSCVFSNRSSEKKPKGIVDTQIQYTLSNQGGLQLILNRFIYCLRYTSRKDENAHRQWKCSDYARKKCPAVVVTKNDVIVKRYGAHSHPFHDRQIMRRIRRSAVFTLLTEAEKQGHDAKLAREKQLMESK